VDRLISVLYVDDEPDLLELGKMFLERSGALHVDTCSSASDALVRLEQSNYDVIISDYQMPAMDGLEFLVRIRNSQREIPFILFTGRGREEVVIEALNHGADFYLQKGGQPLPQFIELEHKIKQAVLKIRSENRIRESEERYRTLFSSANDAIFLLEGGVFIDCNQKAVELFSRAPDKLIGLKPEELSPEFQPDGTCSREKSQEIQNHVLRGTPKVYPWRYLRPDGMPVDVEASVTRLDLTERDLLLVIMRDISPRVQVECALRESAQLMTDIISFLPDATFAVNNEGRVIAWNRAMEEMTGIAKNEIIGMGDYAYALPFYGERRPMLIDNILDNDPSISERYEEIQVRGIKLVSETFSPHLNKGKGAHIWFTASPLIDTHGTVIGAIESIRDVTEHKNREYELRASYEQVAAMEEELRNNFDKLAARQQAVTESERKYRTLFSSMAEGHALNEVIYDETGKPADYRILEVNPAFGKIFGVPRSSSVGRTSYEAFGNIDTAGLARYARVAETGRAEAVEVWYPPMEKYFSILIYSPKKGQFATVFEDITKRKQDAQELRAAYEQITAVEEELRSSFEELAHREQALRTSEEHYRQIVETANEGIWAVDSGMKTTFANARLAAIFGYTVDEMQGMPVMGFIPDEDLLHYNELDYQRKAGTHAAYERRFRKKNGDYIWCYVSVTPLYRTSGEFTGSFAMLTDITARKEAEDDLRKVNDELNIANEQMAALLEEVRSTGEALAVRNHELEEKSRALETSEVSLLQANRKLNLLNTITRHDILNQLTSLFGFLELVQQQVTDPGIQNFLEREKRAAETIKDQIEFTRDYQDVGIQTPEWQNVHDIISSAASTINLRDVTLTIDVGEVEIFADHLLRKVFYTLIENAMRHGGHITRLHFSVEYSPETLKIICEDNGVGIPVEAKEKIFQRKYFQNTGLGLFLSQEILSITGLKMIETGIHNKGSRFEILVPKVAFRGKGSSGNRSSDGPPAGSDPVFQ
jgi:PAS domain S-box-containing protein